MKLACKFNAEYAHHKDVLEMLDIKSAADSDQQGGATTGATGGVDHGVLADLEHKSEETGNSSALVKYQKKKKAKEAESKFLPKTQTQALALRRKMQNSVPTPNFHPQWKLMRVISGHLGWVRGVAVEPGNEWFATGSADRTVKIWDLASGQLKLTLTGHVHTVRSLAVSPRHPYLFSAGEDKMVKCWDLEQNKVIRHYHGHLSGVYSMAMHPTLDLLITGGRDSVGRVWDIRTKHEIMVLGGHQNSVSAIIAQSVDPQVVTGSMDTTMRLWDLRKASATVTLTHHKKSVRALVGHPKEFTFASGGADNVKKWLFPKGKLLKNLSGHNAIVNSLAINDDNVLVSCGDNGTMQFWDWETGYCFQKIKSQVQPGSLDSEGGIFASCFDKSGSRLITCEADKTIKIWKEDDESTQETDPIDMRDWTVQCRKRKRY